MLLALAALFISIGLALRSAVEANLLGVSGWLVAAIAIKILMMREWDRTDS